MATKSIECPKCSNFHIQRRGYRKLKNKIKKQVYCCFDCKCSFTKNPARKNVTDEIRQKIITLFHTYKPTINKYDGMGKSTYSTREIARMTGVSSSAVAQIIQKNYESKI